MWVLDWIMVVCFSSKFFILFNIFVRNVRWFE